MRRRATGPRVSRSSSTEPAGRSRDVNGVIDRIGSFIESRSIGRVVIDSSMLLCYILDDEDDATMRFLSVPKRTDVTTYPIFEMTDPSAYADEHLLAHGVVFFHSHIEDDGCGADFRS